MARRNKIEEIVVDYCTNLFTSSNPLDFKELLQAVQSKVTNPINQMLAKDFSADEVNTALK